MVWENHYQKWEGGWKMDGHDSREAARYAPHRNHWDNLGNNGQTRKALQLCVESTRKRMPGQAIGHGERSKVYWIPLGWTLNRDINAHSLYSNMILVQFISFIVLESSNPVFKKVTICRLNSFIHFLETHRAFFWISAFRGMGMYNAPAFSPNSGFFAQSCKYVF